MDAPIGYISATKQWASENNKNWEDYWKNENSELIHFIGKDNIVFHCIIFPIILKANKGYNLPKNVPANEFLNLEGEKLSTSKNWAIWLHEYLEDFKGQEDSLRYALCATAPENKDTDFTWKDFQAKNNNELVAVFGNFINRVVVLTNKYWDGIIPEMGELQDYDKKVLEELKNTPNKIGLNIEKYRFREALQDLMGLARLGNKYLADTEPWKLKKTDEKRTETIMFVALQIAASLSILSKPFLPFSSDKLQRMLNLKNLSWENTSNLNLKGGDKIEKASLLFSKIEDETIQLQIDKLKS
jgi:methionyl-tRNA synthetase